MICIYNQDIPASTVKQIRYYDCINSKKLVWGFRFRIQNSINFKLYELLIYGELRFPWRKISLNDIKGFKTTSNLKVNTVYQQLIKAFDGNYSTRLPNAVQHASLLIPHSTKPIWLAIFLKETSSVRDVTISPGQYLEHCKICFAIFYFLLIHIFFHHFFQFIKTYLKNWRSQ